LLLEIFIQCVLPRPLWSCNSSE